MFKKLSLILLFVTTFLNATTPTEESITKLYIATFDRAPDSKGLDYWLNDSGFTLEEIAQSFFDQKETQEKYSSEFSNEEFIIEVYDNLFARVPDNAGLNYWIEELDSGRASRDLFILTVMNGAQGDDAKILENKTKVGLAFAHDGRSDIAEARAVIEDITADPDSVYNTLCEFALIECSTLHKNISTTYFWVGEKASDENANMSNIPSAWDDMWMLNYGGVDTPDNRNGFNPANFIPFENPFYFALPYNDFDANGNKKVGITSYIPWATISDDQSKSICKNRWIKIIKGKYVAYAQWEDVGPFGEDDKDYVFGDAQPQKSINDHAGLDLSPAVRDYLNLSDIDSVDWQFVDEEDVPDGPWKNVITTTNINWVDWYRPDINTSWQWQLQGNINISYDVKLYDIDLFDSDTTLIKALKDKDKKVICYFSAGSYENWREDKDDFPLSSLGNDMDGWEGEKWLDISNQGLKPIMKARLDLAVQKGCDGVEPDNMDGYTNNSGFSLSADDQLAYNKFIANEARKRGLSVGLKNDLDQIIELEPFFDFSMNEQCHVYNECDMMQPFIDANKPVFNAEYKQEYIDNNNGERDKMCSDSNDLSFKTLVLPLNLDDKFRYSCD